VTGKNVRKNCH